MCNSESVIKFNNNNNNNNNKNISKPQEKVTNLKNGMGYHRKRIFSGSSMIIADCGRAICSRVVSGSVFFFRGLLLVSYDLQLSHFVG